MTHWTTEFYRRVDQGDRQLVDLLSPDVVVTVGNHEQTRGIEAMMSGELGRHGRVAPTSEHIFRNIWDLDHDTAALDSIVTFHRSDGRDVTLPALTIIRRDKDDRIASLTLFIDNGPLFAGLPGDLI